MEAVVDTSLAEVVAATPEVEAVVIKVEVDMVEVCVSHSPSLMKQCILTSRTKRRLRWWRATTGRRSLAVIAVADAILLSPISRIRTE
jgi:hypothetical protein